MTTCEMIRCKKCNNLIIREDGKWICKEEEKDIHSISDYECPLEEEY